MPPKPQPSSPNPFTRRTLVRNGSYLLAGAAIPRFPSLLAQTSSISPVMQTLSAYIADASARALPPEITDRTKLHILDTIAAMVSGSQLAPGLAALAFARSYGGEPVATIAASNILCGPIEAAFTNGMLAHSDETDDSHAASQSHLGCAVIPATLAAGEKFGIGGLQFIRAVTLGYDIGARVGMTLGGVNYQTESHRDPHATSAGFAAAAAAGSAAGLNARQVRTLLDYAAQESAGIAAWQRDTQHVEKSFVFAGMPARNGVTAALLVKAGWTGVDDIMSGVDNYLDAFAPHANPAGLVDQLGQRYEIAHTNIKKWSVGSPIQAPLDALELLLKQHPFTANQVQLVTISVATREATIVDNRNLPDICLQHLVAVMLLKRTVSFQSAHDVALMKDPAILHERAKVKLVGDEELEKRLPAREATVEITLKDGSVLSQHVDAVRGSAENPMSRDEVATKARDLMDPVLRPDQSRKLVEAVLQLDRTQNIRELRPLLLLSHRT